MANVKEYLDIMKEMKAGNFQPVYLLHGEEPYYIDKISKFIEDHAIEEHERDFNLNIFYGRDLNMATLLETLKRFPMMAQRQVVILREAQDFKEKWTDLESYFVQPVDSTVFVIDFKYKKVDGRLKWVDNAKKNGVLFYSSKHYDNDLPRVIEELAKSMKYRINPHASHLMAEHLGNDLEKIEGELHKLTINVPLSQEIGVDDVKKHIGISREFSQFDYVDALSERNIAKSFHIAYQIGRNDKNTPMVLVISALYAHFSKVMMYHSLSDKSPVNLVRSIPGVRSPYFAGKLIASAPKYPFPKTAQIIEKLREVDARFKGVDSSPISSVELLKELTYFILN
ncbi:MAG: DNA polymerase III subunit delta [Cryomorphaceae bacterium]